MTPFLHHSRRPISGACGADCNKYILVLPFSLSFLPFALVQAIFISKPDSALVKLGILLIELSMIGYAHELAAMHQYFYL
jgi:hypothetical protein